MTKDGRHSKNLKINIDKVEISHEKQIFEK